MATLSGIITPTNVETASSTSTLTNKTIDGDNNTVTNIPLSTGVTGTLPVANGGTGADTLTGVLKGNGTSAVTAGDVDLTSEVTGALPTANGGTGLSTLGTAGQVLAVNSGATGLEYIAPPDPELNPENAIVPVITGTVEIGEIISVSDGGWTGVVPIVITYQWQRGINNISGETSETYTVDIADSGNTLRCVVTATNASGAASVNTADTILIPLVAGAPFGGGFFAGQIGVAGVATHNLVIGPLSTAGQTSAWKNANTTTPGSDSDIDGPQNTADMVADGNSTVYPSAHFCNNLSLGGFSDWYMPAKNELEVCYFNLKPTTDTNNTSSGINSNAVPTRASNYTSGNPAQTSASAFQSGGAEAFSGDHWTSTEFSETKSFAQFFTTGFQRTDVNKNNPSAVKVRAIRRVAV